MEKKLQVASCATLEAQYSALVNAEETRKSREELENVDERLGVVQVAASKAHDDV